MALNRKYATLPDLDSAPDIYETPELTDDNSTAPTANQPHSQDGFEDDRNDSEQDGEQSILRSRLRVSEARSRFLYSNIDADDVDFSDRVDGKRKSYKTSSRQRRILEDGTEELDGASGDDEEESLERKILRLTREVEEVKEENARRACETEPVEHEAHNDTINIDRLNVLSKVLEDISLTPDVILDRDIASTTEPEPTESGSIEDGTARAPTYSITYAPTYEQSHALAKAADFDRRLLSLEKTLGISSSALPEEGQQGGPRALMPAFDSLERQIWALSQASTANLDAISRRVRTLATEQQKLNESREKARALRDDPDKPPQSSSEQGGEEDETKINALYGALSTIENLTPLLSPLLDRLRSLRAIHAEAATASQTLDRIQEDQSEITADLKQWKDGLDQVEHVVKENLTATQGNMKVMEGWVKDLERRLASMD